MLTEPGELLETIANGNLREHTHPNVELKQDWDYKYGQKLSALANKTKMPVCWMVIGIKNDGQLAGQTQKWAIQYEETISQHINNSLDPRQACIGITCHEISGSWIILIGVKNPGEIVFWDTKAFAASGTTIKEMDPIEIMQMRITLPGLTDFSSQPATADYDKAKAQSLVENIRKRGHVIDFCADYEDTIKKLGIHSKQAARILFGDCHFRVVKYDASGEPLSNLSYQGLYGLLTEEFLSEIQKWTVNQFGGDPQPYPPRALKESITNAVAHAAYFEKDGDIILELYPDRLSVSNLCVADSVYFANRWFARSHKTVNSLLMEILRIAGHVDELGRGKNLIFSDSLMHGKHPPDVVIEPAGKYTRWKLWLHGGTKDDKLLRLLERSRNVYKDEQKALIAQALVLWRNKKVNEIRNYIDGDFARQFAEVLTSMNGPIYYYQKEDRIILNRWARVLLEEGLDSRRLDTGEEQMLKQFTYDMCVQFHSGEITPARFREYADMGNTPSEKVLSSNLLSKWEQEGVLSKKKKGLYQFKLQVKSEKSSPEDIQKILEEGGQK